MDRPDQELSELVRGGIPKERDCAKPYTLLQFLRGPVCEGEGHDRRGILTIGEQRRDLLRDDLGLARSGRSDDLDVTAPVPHGRRGPAFKDWNI